MAIFRKLDFWTAATFFLIGAVVIGYASGFDARSRSYPLFLGGALCVLAVGLFVQASLSRSAKTVDREEVNILLAGPALQALLWVVWIVLLAVGAGYLGPSVLIVAASAMLLRGGHHGKSLGQSATIVAVVFFMFYIIFDIPLPVLDVIEELIR
ncbi:tripartite tricarboxylate transporter TctB family protein [Shumkonia mesophila]|uniref:tripartite tricarboxylate transporter TctB family protein n=1 Tax=Shumkonia mesophila TaxID=2838854 RepID=UPI00293453FB|nr:tripartite tricarboxylate transporter TctB family protein [Shumkonia mesophila]